MTSTLVPSSAASSATCSSWLTIAPYPSTVTSVPVRTTRLRWLTLTLIALGSVLVIYVLLNDFEVGAPVTVALCVIALYVVASDSAVRLLRSFKA